MALLTGSRAYGKPAEKSDIDVVVLLGEDDLLRIIDAMGSFGIDPKYVGQPGATTPLRFGVLNLICVTDEEDYRVWEEGTAALIERGPVERPEAVAEFARRRAELKAKREAEAHAV